MEKLSREDDVNRQTGEVGAKERRMRRRAREMMNRALNTLFRAAPELGAMHCVRGAVSDVQLKSCSAAR